MKLERDNNYSGFVCLFVFKRETQIAIKAASMHLRDQHLQFVTTQVLCGRQKLKFIGLPDKGTKPVFIVVKFSFTTSRLSSGVLHPFFLIFLILILDRVF